MTLQSRWSLQHTASSVQLQLVIAEVNVYHVLTSPFMPDSSRSRSLCLPFAARLICLLVRLISSSDRKRKLPTYDLPDESVMVNTGYRLRLVVEGVDSSLHHRQASNAFGPLKFMT